MFYSLYLLNFYYSFSLFFIVIHFLLYYYSHLFLIKIKIVYSFKTYIYIGKLKPEARKRFKTHFVKCFLMLFKLECEKVFPTQHCKKICILYGLHCLLFQLWAHLLEIGLAGKCRQGKNTTQWCERTEPDWNLKIARFGMSMDNKLKMGNKIECKHGDIETSRRLSTGFGEKSSEQRRRHNEGVL